MKRTKVSSGEVSDRGGEFRLSDDIENRKLRHNSHNFQAGYFVKIDFSL